MSLPEPRGWNTWDIVHHTGVVYLPSGLRLRFAFADRGELFTWRHGLADLGRHTIDGRLAEAVVAAGDARLRYRYESSGNTLRGCASVSGDRPLALIVDTMGGLPPQPVALAPGSLRHGGHRWMLRLSVPVVEVESDDEQLRIVAERPGELGFECLPEHGEPDRFEPVPDELRTSGWLGESGAAITRALTWNTVYAPTLGRIVTPASRDFVSREREGFYGSIAIHAWDSLFAGMLAGLLDPRYAHGIFAQVIEQATPAGFLPNRVSDDRGRTEDRSQPPVGALAVLRAYLASGLSDATRDRRLLSDFFEPLRRWNAWWPRARRGPHGLLAYGSDPVPGDEHAGTLDATKRESGLDDSPMYDEVRYYPATHTMDLADVGLNSLYAADLEALAEIAHRLGRGDDAATLHRKYESSRARIDARLFDTGSGGYRNRHADGRFSTHVSPTLLYPLLAGVPSRERAAAIADALLRPEVLGDALLSTARNDPGFSSTYWRGRVWGPIAYLAAEGLRRYGLDDHLERVADELLALHAREWACSHVRENYPARPREDVNALAARSDALHPWGNLLCLVAVQQLVDVRSDGWRFAHPGRQAEIAGLVGGRHTVRAAQRLEVRLDGEPLLIADPAVVIEAVNHNEQGITGRLYIKPGSQPTEPVLVRSPTAGLTELPPQTGHFAVGGRQHT